MRYSIKPVHKCYSCLLNLGDECWLYAYPRGQWRGTRKCPAFGNEEIYQAYLSWRGRPAVRSRRELRREFFRVRRRKVVRRLVHR